jgi:hypothetical protein
MATKLKNPDIFKVDLVPKGAQQLSNISIIKSASKEGKGMAKVNKELDETRLSAIENILGKLKEQLEDILGDSNEADKAEKEDSVAEDSTEDATEDDKTEEAVNEDDVAKGAVDVDSIKKIAELEAKIAKLEDEKIEKQFIEKAAEFQFIGGVTTEQLGRVMKSFATLDPKGYEVFETILKTNNAALEQSSLFAEKGTSRSDSVVTKAAAKAQYDKLVNDKVAAGIKKVDAIQQVLKSEEGIRLYNIINGNE